VESLQSYPTFCERIGAEILTLKTLAWLLTAAALLCGSRLWAAESDAAAKEVLALERSALDGWLKGDPGPMLAIADPGITYYHVMTEKRLEGLEALTALFEPYRGRPLFDSYEIADPKVQAAGDIAVLTYQLVRHNGDVVSRWNATQVYERKAGGWRVVHTHWSQVKAN
jgi:hypothetical protein